MASHIVLRAKVTVDNTGRKLELPAIYIEGQGILNFHLRYLKKHKSKSKSWQRKSTQAICLLLDYAEANFRCFRSPKEMFEAFADRLSSGTYSKAGSDPSGLYWNERTDLNVQSIINHVTHFSDWLYEESGGDSALLNPWRKADDYEVVLNLAAYHQKKSRAFLAHTYSDGDATEKAKQTRNVSHQGNEPSVDITPAIYFDEEHVKPLINNGFRRRGSSPNDPLQKQLNLRDLLITLLMHYGGLRESEPFHLYVDDVMEDPGKPGSALVKVYHPTKGLAPAHYRQTKGQRNATRSDYLMRKFGLEDRWTSRNKAYHAGWKNPLLNDGVGKYFMVQWFPSWAGEYFYTLWRLYMQTQYIHPEKGKEHPFAFTNQFGNPASLSKYIEAHARAIHRIGLTSAKELGTTPHAHRHAYGQRLVSVNVPPLYIRKAMHHKSLESQLVYTQPSNELVNYELSQASARLEQDVSSDQTTHVLAAASQALPSKASSTENLPLFSHADKKVEKEYSHDR